MSGVPELDSLVGGLAAGSLGAFIAVKAPRSRVMVMWLVGACAVVATAGYRVASEWGEPLSLAPVRVLMDGDAWADAYFIAANPQQIVLAIGLCDEALDDDRHLRGVIGIPQARVRQLVMADTVKIHERNDAMDKLTRAVDSARNAEQSGLSTVHKGLMQKACH